MKIYKKRVTHKFWIFIYLLEGLVGRVGEEEGSCDLGGTEIREKEREGGGELQGGSATCISSPSLITRAGVIN